LYTERLTQFYCKTPLKDAYFHHAPGGSFICPYTRAALEPGIGLPNNINMNNNYQGNNNNNYQGKNNNNYQGNNNSNYQGNNNSNYQGNNNTNY
jgi:hypothetical protein